MIGAQCYADALDVRIRTWIPLLVWSSSMAGQYENRGRESGKQTAPPTFPHPNCDGTITEPIAP